MMDTIMPDIPRFYTALAEWLACMIFILPLKKRRREQMLAYSFLTRNSQEMLDMDSLKAYRQEVEKRDANGNHMEFYFVIADLLDQLLPVV